MVRSYLRGGVWKNSEDEILKAAIMKYGKTQWARVASLLPKKSAKQCKARWSEWLDPSIKKTEWKREEDERLLHLAKRMPTQWRTIAPAMGGGRTATQCLRRYQELLSDAAGSGSGGMSVADSHRLRPGEIDPNAEAKPARPDAIDMDEDEQEMLFEAKARLANTQGKKAKRKAREKQLQEARRMAQLQKQRELKAAGIGGGRNRMDRAYTNKAYSGINGAKKRKAGEINYNVEVPFETLAPQGLHDTTEEDRQAASIGFKRLMADDVRGKQKHVIEQEERKKDKARQKRARENNLAESVARVATLNDPGNQRVRSALVLPEPRVGSVEVEMIAKRLKRNGQVGLDKVLLAPTPTANSGLGYGGAPGSDGPSVHRTVMEEARSLIRRGNAKTPLMQEEGPDIGDRDDQSSIREWDSASALATVVRNDAAERALAKARVRHQRSKLKEGFSKLPAPQFAFEVSPIAPSGDGLSHPVKKDPVKEVDLGELEHERRATAEAEEAATWERRSAVLKQNLPRPVDVPPVSEVNTASEDVDHLVQCEMNRLIHRDAIEHPLVPGEAGGDGPRKRKRGDPQNLDEHIDDMYLTSAKAMVHAEAMNPLSDAATAAFIKTWEIIYAERVKREWSNGALAATQLSHLMGLLQKNQKAIAKYTKKTNVYLKGYDMRARKAWEHMQSSVHAISEINKQHHAIRALYAKESAALPKMIALLKDDCDRLKKQGVEIHDARHA